VGYVLACGFVDQRPKPCKEHIPAYVQVGVPNAIVRLARHSVKSTLAVSIHAPNQQLRERLIPSAKAYPLLALMADCVQYFQVRV